MTSFLKDDRSRPVAYWLFGVALLVLVMVVVGGTTRLTDSGLSITTWKPITGALPPLSEAAWQREFDGYKQIPQAMLVNPDMTLEGFKGIFWWEWIHRFLGRLVGAVYAIPFLVFLIRKEIPKRLIAPCLGLLVLGGLQGVVGWWMVFSGLSERVSVAPERLMIHLSLALFLFAGLIWCALEALYGKAREDARGPWARGGLVLTLLVFVQSMLGALVAANDAGRVFNDWPLMGGRVVPEGYVGEGFWNTIAHNQASVQFHHRLFGYLLFAMTVAFVYRAIRSRFIQPQVRSAAKLFGAMILVQMALGISTVLLVAPLWLSLIHQITATLLLAVAAGLTWRARRI